MGGGENIKLYLAFHFSSLPFLFLFHSPFPLSSPSLSLALPPIFPFPYSSPLPFLSLPFCSPFSSPSLSLSLPTFLPFSFLLPALPFYCPYLSLPFPFPLPFPLPLPFRLPFCLPFPLPLYHFIFIPKPIDKLPPPLKVGIRNFIHPCFTDMYIANQHNICRNQN